MADRIKQTYPGQDARAIYERLVAQLGEVAQTWGLHLDRDDEALTGRVHKRGMVDVRFSVAGETLAADLDFGMLMPKAIREKVRVELDRRLGALFA